MFRVFLAMMFLACAGRAEDWRTEYRWSVAAVCAAASYDAASSWRISNELNPILRDSDGGFGTRGLVIKSAVTGAGLLTQHYVVRKYPKLRKMAAVVNFGVAAGLTALATNNIRVRSR